MRVATPAASGATATAAITLASSNQATRASSAGSTTIPTRGRELRTLTAGGADAARFAVDGADDRRAARAPALLALARAHHRHPRGCNLLRFLRLAGDRLCAAGHHSRLEHCAGEGRRASEHRQFWPGRRRGRLWMDRRARRARAGGAYYHCALCRHVVCVRIRANLRPAVLVPLRRGHRPRRGNPGCFELHQRDSARAAPRQLLSRLPDDFPGWPAWGGARRSRCRSFFRLALDVHHRRRAGSDRARVAAFLPRVTALARMQRPLARGRRDRDPYRAHRLPSRRAAVATAAANQRATGCEQDATARAVYGPLRETYAARLGVVGVVLYHFLRPAGLDTDALPRDLSSHLAAVAQLCGRRSAGQRPRLSDLRLFDRPDRPPLLVHRRVSASGGQPHRVVGDRRTHRSRHASRLRLPLDVAWLDQHEHLSLHGGDLSHPHAGAGGKLGELLAAGCGDGRSTGCWICAGALRNQRRVPHLFHLRAHRRHGGDLHGRDPRTGARGSVALNMNAGIGQALHRKEDRRLLTGTGRYSDDVYMPGQAYAYMVRSPHAHARIRAIATTRALAVPGVIAVLTGRDAMADGLRPIPHSTALSSPPD